MVLAEEVVETWKSPVVRGREPGATRTEICMVVDGARRCRRCEAITEVRAASR